MDADDLSWRWPAAQLTVLAEIAQAGAQDGDATNSMEALETRMRVGLQAAQLVDDLIGRLMLALLDAGATPVDVAALMGLVSTQAVHRRAARARQRLREVDSTRSHAAGGGPDHSR